MKKVLSLFLAVMMVASIIAMMPVFTVSAADPSYDGDSFDPRNIIRHNKLATIDTNSISTANGSNSASKLFDGNHTGTKWEFGSSAGGDYQIAFKTTEVVTVANYVLFTGGDTETYSDRNPRSFTLWGSADGVTYTEIDIVTTTGLDAVNSTPYGYTVDTPKAYQYYKLTFKADGGYFQLNELQLYTADDGRDTDLNSLTYNRYNIPCSAGANVGCGFIDGNIRPIDTKIYPTISDIFGTNDKNTILNNTKVYVDGVEANLNNGYLGYTHNSIHDGYAFGIIGTSLTAGQSTDITFLIGDDYYMSFTLDGNNIGVNAHQVISSETTYYNDNEEFGSDRNSLVAKVTFADSVPVQVGEEVDFRLHDEHGTERTATVSAIEGNTITFVATNFTTEHSLCEFTFADESKFSITIDHMPSTKSAIGFVQTRENADNPETTFDVRVLVEAFEDFTANYNRASLTVTFTQSNGTPKTFEVDSTVVYKSIMANGEVYTASGKCGLFGCVIVGVPKGTPAVASSVTFYNDEEETSHTIDLGAAVLTLTKDAAVSDIKTLNKYDASKITVTNTNDGKDINGKEGASFLFDGTNEKHGTGNSPFTIEFKTTDAISIAGIIFTVGNDSFAENRFYATWKLEGQNGDKTWSTVAQSNKPITKGSANYNEKEIIYPDDLPDSQRQAYSVENAGTYTVYRLTVTSSSGYKQMGEITLYTAN